MVTQIILAVVVAVLIIAVLVFFLSQKKTNDKLVKPSPVQPTRFVDASQYVSVSVSNTGNYTGGADAPSYTRQPIMIAEVALIDEIEDLNIAVAFSYSYISGFNNGSPVVKEGEMVRNVTLTKKENKVTLMCEPALNIKVISVLKQ